MHRASPPLQPSKHPKESLWCGRASTIPGDALWRTLVNPSSRQGLIDSSPVLMAKGFRLMLCPRSALPLLPSAPQGRVTWAQPLQQIAGEVVVCREHQLCPIHLEGVHCNPLPSPPAQLGRYYSSFIPPHAAKVMGCVFPARSFLPPR